MPEEETYKSEQDLKDKTQSRAELAQKWETRIQAADRAYTSWAERFQVSKLYQYYEGFQSDDISAYVVNMIYATIETKLPNLIFNNPQFALRPRPDAGDITFDMENAAKQAQIREDVLNFICAREEFGLTDKHELAILDAFFGFGVIESGYSEEMLDNPYLSQNEKDPLNNLYTKQIPFDTFRVSADANWDLSMGKWWGYYEFVPFETLEGKPGFKQKFSSVAAESLSNQQSSGEIVMCDDSDKVVAPPGHSKIYRIWDFHSGKYIVFCPDDFDLGHRILEYESFDSCPISVLRFGKRRKGWYPLPPVFNWISPQEEINDIRQAHRIHRKRFTRKYAVLQNAVDEPELEKFLYGPDGQAFIVNREKAIEPVSDPPLDSANQQSLIISYNDMNRVTGITEDDRAVANRTTATQAGIQDRRSQVRQSKDSQRVGNFLCSVARNIMRSLRKAKEPFWALTNLRNENVMGPIQSVRQAWKMIPPVLFEGDNNDISVNVTSISPVYAQEDKRNFLEFLAVLTQYEILSFSPALLREAAYRCGYKNEAVLSQFQELSQLTSIGRLMQAKAQVSQAGPTPTEPGQLAQQQTDVSTPSDAQSIMNLIFNKQGVQPAE
jgi:hypothetical protein